MGRVVSDGFFPLNLTKGRILHMGTPKYYFDLDLLAFPGIKTDCDEVHFPNLRTSDSMWRTEARAPATPQTVPELKACLGWQHELGRAFRAMRDSAAKEELTQSDPVERASQFMPLHAPHLRQSRLSSRGPGGLGAAP